MLHSRRRRLAEIAAREGAGENFWTDDFDEPARAKIVHAFRDAAGQSLDAHTFYETARDLILRDEGLHFLVKPRVDAIEDLLTYVLQGPHEMMPTVVEAMTLALRSPGMSAYSRSYSPQTRALRFERTMEVILREHRISYELIDGQMVEFSSRELHVAVVAPALQLLSGRPDLAGVERAYRDALEELSKNKGGDAITDAGTALQEMLVALGCSGNALGPLIKSAKGKGLLAAHDTPLLEGVEKVLQWVSADRSQSGDAHSASDPSLDDAWLTVHVVGAVILRLSKPGQRG